MPFKPYDQNQMLLLPPSLGDLIGEKDLCRVISDFVDSLPRSEVEGAFHNPEGCPPYHPRMMLKVLLYAYTQKEFSSRRIAKQLRENIHFMWLAAMEQPSHNTVNRFRSDYLSGCLPRILGRLAQMLLKDAYIRNEDYFVDGTVMEANAGKNTWVWRKNTERYKKRVQERAEEIIRMAEEIDREEDKRYEGKDLPERGESSTLTQEKIREVARSLKDKDSSEAAKAGRALEEESEKLGKYEKQEETLGGRNSYSKTDPDATFMRTKQDLLRPAYNVMAGTQDGFVTGISVHQTPNDASAFIAHMESRKTLDVPAVPNTVGDAIFGTEENYAYLEKEGIESYLKYPSFYRESKGKTKPYEKAAFTYDEKEDRFYCPQGRGLDFEKAVEKVGGSGYVSTVRQYECADCSGCPVKKECTTGAKRTIRHSPKLVRYREATKRRLESEKGVALRKRRGPEIETVFGHIKQNLGLRRFLLRGLHKVTAEIHWIVLGYNLQSLRNRMKNPQPA